MPTAKYGPCTLQPDGWGRHSWGQHIHKLPVRAHKHTKKRIQGQAVWIFHCAPNKLHSNNPQRAGSSTSLTTDNGKSGDQQQQYGKQVRCKALTNGGSHTGRCSCTHACLS